MPKKYTRKHIHVWKENFGNIPKDSFGRSYEIHHIDGNKENNDIRNLLCISIDEHYKIHYEQGDYGAAFLIARRMENKPKEISEIARKITNERIRNKTHNFLSPNFNRSLYHNRGFVVARDKETGKNVRIRKEIYDTSDRYVGVNSDRKQKKVHTNRGGNKGKKWKQEKKELSDKKCLYCNFVGRGSHISRYHNERCKNNGNKTN